MGCFAIRNKAVLAKVSSPDGFCNTIQRARRYAVSNHYSQGPNMVFSPLRMTAPLLDIKVPRWG